MTDEKPLKATLKAGAGYDAPWLTVDMPNPVEGAAMLEAVRESALLQELVQTAEVLKGLNKVNAGASEVKGEQTQKPSGGGWGSGGQNPTNGASSGGEVRFHPEGIKCGRCGEGVRYKEVFSKAKQKTFKFWSCPAQSKQGDGHYSEFAD